MKWNIWKEMLYWLVFVCSWIYVVFFLYPVSVIANTIWIVRMIKNKALKSTIQEMKTEAAKIKNWKTVTKKYSQFNYKYDGFADMPGVFGMWPTWVPLMVVFFYRVKMDNCDGAERYARWLIKQFNKNQGQNVKARKQIVVPLLNLKKVHYYTVVYGPEAWSHNLVFSSGQIWIAKPELYKAMASGYDYYVKLYPYREG